MGLNRLVKLAARAFYDDITTKGDNQPKTGRSDNRGMAVVVLDALTRCYTRCQWVREEDLAKDLKLHSKQLRCTLRFFEEEKLVTRDHRRETAKGAKIFSAAVAATADGGQIGKEGEEKIKMHTHFYCCLDYAQVALCRSESDKLAAQEMGDGVDNARRRRREKLKDMLQKMEYKCLFFLEVTSWKRMQAQLKPLIEQLSRVKDLAVPEFGSLQAWEARANAAGHAANGDSSANDSSKSSQGQGYGGTAMPFLGETRVEVALSGAEAKEEDTKPNTANMSMKVLPPWMIKQGMNLTKEQRGEAKQETKMDSSLAPAELSDDKKSKDEYAKAYYAAILKRQQEQEEENKRKQQELYNTNNAMNGVPDISSDRRVGMKSKRDEDGRDDDVEWEEAPTAGTHQLLPCFQMFVALSWVIRFFDK
ncbi:hypothetical protein HHK36_007003 [Tetracentron sinense]|uniref:HTH TFE/IIEalpha-type domain-containing protein n=1 Tax=Tetracentron sinense TaxID=13715 RepID=A0A835DLF1_TETSI|nr:hypothetical protein HHK36_007003 [Tetracentron sinense]